RSFHPYVAGTVRPVDYLINHQHLVRDKIFGSIAGDYRNRPDPDFADLAKTLQAAGIGHRDYIAGLDRAVHEKNDACDQIAESFLQSKADGETESAGKHGQGGEIDPEQIDAQEDRQRPDGYGQQFV